MDRPSNERPDPELVRRYLAGDKAAFTALVHRHERRVFNLALRMLGREEDARDATQDAFLTALRKLSSFRGDSAFTTWMHRVTMNTCYDILRKRQREPVVDTSLESVPTWGATVHDHAEATAIGTDVQRALLQVQLEFRAVLVLHDVQDMGYDQVADILGIPVGTVKSRLHRGRVALARLLSGERSDRSPTSEDADTSEPDQPLMP